MSNIFLARIFRSRAATCFSQTPCKESSSRSSDGLEISWAQLQLVFPKSLKTQQSYSVRRERPCHELNVINHNQRGKCFSSDKRYRLSQHVAFHARAWKMTQCLFSLTIIKNISFVHKAIITAMIKKKSKWLSEREKKVKQSKPGV